VLRNVPSPPARVILRGSRILKGAPAAAGALAAAATGGLIISRRQVRPFYGGIGAFSNIPPAGGAAAVAAPV
jgi:hypothetical protein